MAIVAVDCYQKVKKDIEHLERQIQECPVMEKCFIERGIEYLCLKNIYYVLKVGDDLIDSYMLWLQEQGIRDINLARIYQKNLRDWREFHLNKEFVKLIKEMEACDAVEQTYKNKVYTFMTENRKYSLEEIDWDVRVSYERYLMKTINEKNRSWYLKNLDRLKLFDIKRRNSGMRECGNRLMYEEKRIYLGYHPDYNLAKEFYYCKNTKGLIWDFSICASQKLKCQVFAVLNYALENLSGRELRRGYLAPLHFFYMHCIDREISDLTRLEQDQIDDYANKAKKVSYVNDRYYQIVDKIQKILFLQSKDIDWEANVWYLERFQFGENRYASTRSVKCIHKLFCVFFDQGNSDWNLKF